MRNSDGAFGVLHDTYGRPISQEAEPVSVPPIDRRYLNDFARHVRKGNIVQAATLLRQLPYLPAALMKEGALGNVVLSAPNLQMLEILRQNNVSLEVGDRNGQTVFHRAHTLDWFNFCWNAGLDINARNNAGQTPLFGKHDLAVVKKMVEKGADVTVVSTNTNETPLMFLLRTHPQSTEVIAFLAQQDYTALQEQNPQVYEKQEQLLSEWAQKSNQNHTAYTVATIARPGSTAEHILVSPSAETPVFTDQQRANFRINTRAARTRTMAAGEQRARDQFTFRSAFTSTYTIQKRLQTKLDGQFTALRDITGQNEPHQFDIKTMQFIGPGQNAAYSPQWKEACELQAQLCQNPELAAVYRTYDPIAIARHIHGAVSAEEGPKLLRLKERTPTVGTLIHATIITDLAVDVSKQIQEQYRTFERESNHLRTVQLTQTHIDAFEIAVRTNNLTAVDKILTEQPDMVANYQVVTNKSIVELASSPEMSQKLLQADQARKTIKAEPTSLTLENADLTHSRLETNAPTATTADIPAAPEISIAETPLLAVDVPEIDPMDATPEDIQNIEPGPMPVIPEATPEVPPADEAIVPDTAGTETPTPTEPTQRTVEVRYSETVETPRTVHTYIRGDYKHADKKLKAGLYTTRRHRQNNEDPDADMIKKIEHLENEHGLPPGKGRSNAAVYLYKLHQMQRFVSDKTDMIMNRRTTNVADYFHKQGGVTPAEAEQLLRSGQELTPEQAQQLVITLGLVEKAIGPKGYRLFQIAGEPANNPNYLRNGRSGIRTSTETRAQSVPKTITVTGTDEVIAEQLAALRAQNGVTVLSTTEITEQPTAENEQGQQGSVSARLAESTKNRTGAPLGKSNGKGSR